MRIEDLVRRSAQDSIESAPIDPLREEDALQEAQLLDVRLEALSSTICLLFELRTAMNLMDGNTAVLVGRGLRKFEWSAEARETDKTAWNVVGSEPRRADGLFVFRLSFLPVASMWLAIESAEFYVGDVPGLLEQLPDYVEDGDATIRRNLPNWGSSFEPIWSTILTD